VSVVKLTLGTASGRIFALPRLHGTASFRIYMPVNSAGIGLLDGASGTQLIHRR